MGAAVCGVVDGTVVVLPLAGGPGCAGVAVMPVRRPTYWSGVAVGGAVWSCRAGGRRWMGTVGVVIGS